MIWLAVLPGALLLLIVAIAGNFALKLRHGDAQDISSAERKKESDFRRDDKNDGRLVQQIELGAPGLVDATTEYLGTRIEIAPNANAKNPSGWTQDDYERRTRKDLRSKRSDRIRKMAWSAGRQIVGAFAIATVAAAFLYQNLTTTNSTGTAPQVLSTAPVAELDPFADSVASNPSNPTASFP